MMLQKTFHWIKTRVKWTSVYHQRKKKKKKVILTEGDDLPTEEGGKLKRKCAVLSVLTEKMYCYTVNETARVITIFLWKWYTFYTFFPLDDVDGEKKKGSEWADTDRDYTYIEVF